MPDIEAASQFYQKIVPYDEVERGVFAGINYISLMKSGEVGLCIFEQREANPLAASFPTFQVKSVAGYAKEIQKQGARILLPSVNVPAHTRHLLFVLIPMVTSL